MSDIPIYQIAFSIHAIKRMFERSISKTDVLHVLATGEVIKEYPRDTPYPSQLVLGWCGNRPLHVTVAIDANAQKMYIITGYEPDVNQWKPNFRRKNL